MFLHAFIARFSKLFLERSTVTASGCWTGSAIISGCLLPSRCWRRTTSYGIVFFFADWGRGFSPDPDLRDLFHFYSPEKLYALGKEISPGEELEVGPMPCIGTARLLDYRDDSLHSATKRSIANAQSAIRQWNEAWVRGDHFQSLPKCPESEKAADFAELWSKTFAPLHDWLRDAALGFWTPGGQCL